MSWMRHKLTEFQIRLKISTTEFETEAQYGRFGCVHALGDKASKFTKVWCIATLRTWFLSKKIAKVRNKMRDHA